MAADLFETYVVTVVATMVLASIYFAGGDRVMPMMLYPLAIGALCVITSIIGTYFVRLGKSQSIMGALYKGVLATGVLSLILLWPLTAWLVGMDTVMTVGDLTFTGKSLFLCGAVGLVITALIVVITEYYTGTNYRPVQSIAKASVTGHGTNVIQGLAVSMEATALPALVIMAGILITYGLAGLFGIAIAVTTMLALAGMIVALDAFGPVTDNAGGIAEMSGMPKEIRKTTDALDAVGNTTKAVTKGYAIGSAGLGRARAVRGLYRGPQIFRRQPRQVSLFPGRRSRLHPVEPIRRGRPLPRRTAALSVRRHRHDGRGTRGRSSIVEEVRRQFKEKPGIMKGTDRPDYKRAVDLLTRAAIKEMIVPSLLPVLSPIVFYFVVNAIAGKSAAFSALGAMLLGVIVTGLFVAISMTAGGGAWDNAKKYIEDGHYGGKGSEAHKAAVTGDTVGDPYKDTAGPAVNPMIKITNIVALLLLAVLAHQ